MAINLLIDTCILRRLVSKSEFSYNLLQLEFLVKGKHVELLVPEVLLTEWDKHREEERQIILKSLRVLEKEVKQKRLLQDDSAEFLQERIDDAKRMLNSQLDMIDDLLLNHGRSIATSPELLMMVHKQRSEKKMPFKNTNKDNYNDAVLIFSALNYLESISETTLYFISGNTSEFAFGERPNCILRPEISGAFPTVSVHYFTDIKDTYAAFDRLNLPRYVKRSDRKRGKIETTIFIDRKKPVLDQVHDYLEKRFTNIIVIPKKLFAQHYPFIVADTYQYVPIPFTLITDNEDVYKLLTDVKINAGVVEDSGKLFVKNDADEKKIKEIYKYLYANFLHNVAFKNNDAVPLTYSEAGNKCDCSLCLYKRLDFAGLMQSEFPPLVNNSEQEIMIRLRSAYGQYKIGKFIEAADQFQILYDERKDKKDTLLYIIAFNLSHLAYFLRGAYWDDNAIQKRTEELLAFDLESVYNDCLSRQNKDILDWLHDKEFMNRTLSGMHEKVNSIIDFFYGQNSGHNSKTRALMEHYLVTDAFLNQNSIIYDGFSEYDTLADLFIQGLLASYGCSLYLGGRLNYFSDLLLEKVMFSAKAEVIQKFLNRYKLSEIEYNSGAVEGSTFIDNFENLLDNYDEIVISYEKNTRHDHRYFWDNCNEIIYNSLTLVAMLRLDPVVINRVAGKALQLFDEKKHLFYFQWVKHLQYFFVKKYKHFTEDMLEKYFVTALKNKDAHNGTLFETITSILEEKNIKIDLDENDFDYVRNNFLDPGTSSEVRSWYSIGYIYSMVNDEAQKSEIRAYVKQSVLSRFEAGKYFLATMFDMLPEYEDFIQQYEDAIEEIIKTGPRKTLFDNKDYYTDSRLDNFLNFCYKFNIEVPAEFVGSLPTMGGYYNWLADMDNFDYSNFRTDWLYIHFTIFFKRKFRQSAVLKYHLLKLIKSDPDPEIERIFIMIYCLED
jgi:hypothetical protein